MTTRPPKIHKLNNFHFNSLNSLSRLMFTIFRSFWIGTRFGVSMSSVFRRLAPWEWAHQLNTFWLWSFNQRILLYANWLIGFPSAMIMIFCFFISKITSITFSIAFYFNQNNQFIPSKFGSYRFRINHNFEAVFYWIQIDSSAR